MNGSVGMNPLRQFFLLSVTSMAAVAAPALAQTVVPSVGAANSAARHVATIPDFSGVWARAAWPGFDPPLTGPGPVVNRARLPNGVGDTRRFVGDYTNPILKPAAADIVKQHGEISLAGIGYGTPANQCWAQPVPYIFWNLGLQVLQQPDKVTFLYFFDHEARQVRLNEPHPARVTPSLHGDSVGHFEGDTLVIDTVGVRTNRPFAMVDVYGTPYSPALHVVERYRLIDYEAAKEAQERGEKENLHIPTNDSGLSVDPNYRGKGLQLDFKVADEGVFTVPWTASVTYRRGIGQWPEYVCSENAHVYYDGKDAAVPRADKPDF
jgi:hypothetical protein